MNERDRAVRDIADTYTEHTCGAHQGSEQCGDCDCLVEGDKCKVAQEFAEHILSLKDEQGKDMLAVLSDDQGLPENKYKTESSYGYTTLRTDREELIGHNAYLEAQQDMVDWRRVYDRRE